MTKLKIFTHETLHHTFVSYRPGFGRALSRAFVLTVLNLIQKKSQGHLYYLGPDCQQFHTFLDW